MIGQGDCIAITLSEAYVSISTYSQSRDTAVASLTIRNIDDGTKRRLKMRAARNGHSLEQDLRLTLLAIAAEEIPDQRSDDDIKARYDRIMALALPPLEPFDQKAVSDEINDFVP